MRSAIGYLLILSTLMFQGQNTFVPISFSPFQVRIGGISGLQTRLIGGPTQDGGYLQTSEQHQMPGVTYYIVVKLDSYGEVQWVKRIGNRIENQGKGVIQLSNGDLVALMSPIQLATSFSTIMLVKFTQTDSIQWSVEIAKHQKKNQIMNAIPTQNGGILIAGISTSTTNAAIWDTILIKLDQYGGIDRIKGYGNSNGSQTPQSLIELSQGGFFTCGLTTSFTQSSNIYLTLFDANLNLKWTRVVGTLNQKQKCTEIAQSTDQNYLYFAGMNGGGMDAKINTQILVGKVDFTGNLVWLKCYYAPHQIETSDLIITYQGTLLIVGVFSGIDANKFILLQLDQNGSILISKIMQADQILLPKISKLLNEEAYVLESYIFSPPFQFVNSYLDRNLNYCGAMEMNNFLIQMRDVTNHSDLFYIEHLFEERPDHVDFQIFSSTTGIIDQTNVASFKAQEHCYVSSDPAIQQVSLLSPTDADCGCYNSGACDTQSGDCSCQVPYILPLCKYTESDYYVLSQRIEVEVLSLKTKFTGTNTIEILTQLRSFTSNPDLINRQTALYSFELISLLTSTRSPSIELLKALNILSYLCQVVPYYTSIITQFYSVITNLLIESADKISTFTSNEITIAHLQLQNNNANSILIVQNSQFEGQINLSSVSVPDSEGLILSCAMINQPIYHSIRPTNKREATPVMTVILHSNRELVKVSDLRNPIKLSFPINKEINSLKNIIDDVYLRKTKTQQEIIQNKDIECLFFNKTSGSMSDEGCTVQGFTYTHIDCACTHLTDFMAFVRGSYEPLHQSNYHSFSALKDVT